MRVNKASLMLHTIQVEWLKNKHVLQKFSLIPAHHIIKLLRLSVQLTLGVFPGPAVLRTASPCVDCRGSLGQLSWEQTCQCQMLRLGGSSSSVSKNRKGERGPMLNDWERSVHPHWQTSVGKEGCFSLQQCIKNGFMLAWLYSVQNSRCGKNLKYRRP